MIELRSLRNLSLFANVTGEQLKRFVRCVHIKHYKPGTPIFTAHDDHHRLYLLLDGYVKTHVVSPQGKEQITNLFYSGDAFGGLIFGPEQDPRPWATAVSEVSLVSLSELEFKGLMRTYNDVCMNIFHYLVEHHQRHIRRIQTLVHTKASHRLVLTLLHIGDRQGDSAKPTFRIGPGFTHEHFANMIGVVRSTVSELMGDLRRHGVVSGRSRSYLVNRSMAYQFLNCDQQECEEALTAST